MRKKRDFVVTEMKYFDAELKSWRPLPSMARLAEATECICAEVVGNYLYVAAKIGHALVMYRYHTVSNVWETLPDFQGDPSIDCLCSVDEHIYAFSNSGMPQRYVLAKNDWQSGSKLPFLKKKDDEEKLVFVKAVSMKSKIYVLHGYYKEEWKRGEIEDCKAKPALVHCFDPHKNVWKRKASTIHPHFESTLFVNNNQLYVAGGLVSISCDEEGNSYASGNHAPVEVYNEVDNSWFVVAQKHIPSNNLGAVELLGGKVYFILNKFPIDTGIRIPPNEVYKISLRGWEHLKTIGRAAVLCYLPVKKEMLNEFQEAAESLVSNNLEQD